MKKTFLLISSIIISSISAQTYKVGGSSKYGKDFEVVPTQQYEIFEVSKVGKDKKKLTEVYDTIERWENENRAYGQIYLDKKDEEGESVDVNRNKSNDVKPYQWKVLHRIDESNYIVYDNAHGKCKLELLKPKELADGEYVVALSKRTDKTFYHDNSHIRIYVETDEPFEKIELPNFTKDEFLQRLKSGECWKLRKPVACRKCFGDGKLSALEKYRDCPDCAAIGIVDYIVYVVWDSSDFKVIGVE